jgi:hypothetical protein
MLTMPQEMMKVILPFVALFSETVWDYAQILLMGAILAPGKRTVSATLTVMGLKDDPQYQNYHRVLNRAKWCGLTASKLLLGTLVQVFVAANAPIILGADETLERRKGDQIKQKGVFRDPVRSSKKYLVHSFGLRWVSMMLIVSVPWSSRPWALPFLTLNAPSEASNKANGKRHKTSIDLIKQMVCLVRRWLRGRALVLVTDGGLTAVKMGLTCGALRQPVVWVSRLRPINNPRVNQDLNRKRGNGSTPCKPAWTTATPNGRNQKLSGMVGASTPLSMPSVKHFGIPPALTPYPFAGLH